MVSTHPIVFPFNDIGFSSDALDRLGLAESESDVEKPYRRCSHVNDVMSWIRISEAILFGVSVVVSRPIHSEAVNRRELLIEQQGSSASPKL